jgi:hypothetical protein
MGPEEFRRIALSMPEAEEVYRHGQSQFRVSRKTFATLEGAIDSWAVVRLTPDQQAVFVGSAFVPVSGGEGRLGATVVRLDTADETTVKEALAAAWGNVVPRGRRKRSRAKAATLVEKC